MSTTTRVKNDDAAVITAYRNGIKEGKEFEAVAAELGVEPGNRVSQIRKQLKDKGGYTHEQAMKILPEYPGRNRGGKKKDEAHFASLASFLDDDLTGDSDSESDGESEE